MAEFRVWRKLIPEGFGEPETVTPPVPFPAAVDTDRVQSRNLSCTRLCAIVRTLRRRNPPWKHLLPIADDQNN